VALRHVLANSCIRWPRRRPIRGFETKIVTAIELRAPAPELQRVDGCTSGVSVRQRGAACSQRARNQRREDIKDLGVIEA
jgi:hypothetical protein